METKITEIAERIKTIREILEITPEDMAQKTGMSVDDYNDYEAGNSDFSFSFLYECSRIFGIDIIELLTGENPKLSAYTIVRGGKGLPMRRRKGFTYEHMAYRMKNKLGEPFIVTAPYREEEQAAPIYLSRHKGQEFDYIISGSLKVQIEDHVDVLHPGDTIYYDSNYGHGMIATGGTDCVFLAIVMGE